MAIKKLIARISSTTVPKEKEIQKKLKEMGVKCPTAAFGALTIEEELVKQDIQTDSFGVLDNGKAVELFSSHHSIKREPSPLGQSSGLPITKVNGQ